MKLFLINILLFVIDCIYIIPLSILCAIDMLLSGFTNKITIEKLIDWFCMPLEFIVKQKEKIENGKKR